MQGNISGCMICGKDLAYQTDSVLLECAVCGAKALAEASCVDGHFVCDDCHRGDLLDIVERRLINSTERDPILLASGIFDMPGLKMHGPEYHSIVPAIIVAAYQNLNSARNESEIREAIRRGKDFKGGSCGFSGTCGACAGAGIAASVITKATPMTGESRGLANKVTGMALVRMSEYGGARCCKREAITAIEAYIAATGEFDGVEPSVYQCGQSLKNKDCIGIRCPYFSVRH